jgi:predicted ferric reductase
MTISNLVVVVFLSLKNTPLAFFSAWSYERLNKLHQVAGYVTTSLVIIHASSYATYFSEMENFKKLRANEEIFGYAAGFSFLFIAFSAIVVRRFWYELFYVMHLFFFMSTVVFVGLHQPFVARRIMIVTCIVGGLWLVDRFWRFFRLVYYSFNNDVTVTPLPSGGTRIQLRKSPKNFPGGSHCFLWIPAIRAFEMHPFTLVGDNEHEFVVACYDGFTRQLRNYAEKNPGVKLKASVEGPYGKFPDPFLFDRVVMIAGGSGASFTVGTAMSMTRRWKEGKPISFHWMVKDRSEFFF